MLREEEAVDGEEYPEETNVGSEEVGATELLAELVETPDTVCRTPWGEEESEETVSTNLQDVIELSILKGVVTEVVDEDVVNCIEDWTDTGRDDEGVETVLGSTGHDLQRDLWHCLRHKGQRTGIDLAEKTLKQWLQLAGHLLVMLVVLLNMSFMLLFTLVTSNFLRLASYSNFAFT